jgi:hypothetical protein
MGDMVRQTEGRDFETIYTIINDAAEAYRGVIPPDCWHDPSEYPTFSPSPDTST